jgi:hypothetical protein
MAVSCVLKLHANFPELLSTMSSHIPVDRFHFINIFSSICQFDHNYIVPRFFEDFPL